jgi:hypothetical protein
VIARLMLIDGDFTLLTIDNAIAIQSDVEN